MLMRIRWGVLCLLALICLGIYALMTRTATVAASPETAPAVAPSAPKAAAASNPGPLSIPDTTSAVNSATPMSQRVVHYEIDAKYDTNKHTVDASEVLTYHNLTGQPLDHFPFGIR